MCGEPVAPSNEVAHEQIKPNRAFHSPPLHAISPNQMIAAARLEEIAEILAAGLTRLRFRQSSALPAVAGESSLDCAAAQSRPANVLTDGGKR